LLQEYLDGEILPAQARALREHLSVCPRCTAELALYRQTFEALDRMRLWSPSQALAERVLDRVLPSRLRRRWVKTVGWSYAGALALSLAAVMVWVSQPTNRSLVASLADELSRRLVQTLIFVLNLLTFAIMSLANGWGLVTAAGQRLAPLTRALASLFSNPGIQAALALAGAVCVAVLWWMRPREKRTTEEVRRVGVLGI
jgi:anti-sigma factor RsiW